MNKSVTNYTAGGNNTFKMVWACVTHECGPPKYLLK